MSAYVRAARALGAEVSGSDAQSSPYIERLAADGVLEARIGHAPANVPAGAEVEVVYSSAVPAENPERTAARERGLAERPRAEILSELSALRQTIAVAGSHGKTTTASMIVHALRAAELDPSWLVGGPVGGGLANAHWSEGRWLVVEADESDRSMLSLHVEVALLMNVELDHHATFASLAELREAFRAFLARASGAIVLPDSAELVELAPSAEELDGEASAPARHGAGRGSGSSRPALVLYEQPRAVLDPQGSRFSWRGAEVRLRVPGEHNALNAAAALEAARVAGAEEERSIAGLAAFTGAGRRFQLLGRTRAGALIYDDYAHHPSEVAATLRAARTLAPRRLVAVFQPHLYSRTAMLAREFGRALAEADIVIVLDVYPARERSEDHPGVSGLSIAEASADAAAGRPVYWLPELAAAQWVLAGMLEEADLCLLMGAGDIDSLARGLVGA